MHIAGKTIVLEPKGADNQTTNGLFEHYVYDGSGGVQDISDLTIAAETLVISGHAHFPHTNVTIFAKRLAQFRSRRSTGFTLSAR